MEDGIFHVFARGNDRALLFRDDVDRASYLGLLRRVVRRQEWRVLAYCLMDNHVHLIVQTPNADLGRGMQRLHGVYAQTFNARHGRVGHLFQGRYGSVRVETDAQLWQVTRNVVRNPVAAGVCQQPEDFPWSSHRAVLAASADPLGIVDVERVLAFFGAAGGEPLVRYSDFVGRPDAEDRRPAPPADAAAVTLVAAAAVADAASPANAARAGPRAAKATAETTGDDGADGDGAADGTTQTTETTQPTETPAARRPPADELPAADGRAA